MNVFTVTLTNISRVCSQSRNSMLHEINDPPNYVENIENEVEVNNKNDP